MKLRPEEPPSNVTIVTSGDKPKRKRKTKDTRAFWAADCETDPFKHKRVPKPFIWGLYTGHSYHTFKTAEEFVEFVKDQDVIIYFHNGGKFDIHFLLKWITLGVECRIINGRLVTANIGRCELRDSYNILPVPLSKFGNKLEIDYTKLEAKVRALHMPEILAYLKVDCVDLWDNISAFERTYGRHLTLAGACMDQWKKISGEKAPRSDQYFFDKFAQYYAGGRVQCFEKGHIKGPLKMFDVRSAYPTAMLEEHPYGTVYVETLYPTIIKPTSFVKVECVSNGALFYRNDKGTISFPDDHVLRTYHVTGHEYLAAMETQSLSRVKLLNAIDFMDLKDFAIYIHHFYNKRKVARAEKDKPQIVFTKLFMTNLYGKFGANPKNYGTYMCVPFDEISNYPGFEFDGMIGPHALLRKPLDENEENYINVATAASITGWERANLWRAIHGCTRPIYCDTDSLACEDAPALKIGEELGEWNFEGTIDDAYIVGKKMYGFKGQFEDSKTEKLASKGVRMTMAQMIRAATGKTVTARSDAPTFTLKGKRKVYFQSRRVRMTA